MSQALSTATLQNPGKITNLEQLAQLVGQGNHVPIWADRALAQSLVRHYGSNGMVVAHPGGGIDIPPASTGYGPGGEPIGGPYQPSGPTVLINPPDAPYAAPFHPGGNVPSSPSGGGPAPVGYNPFAGMPITGAGPNPGGNANPSNPGYVAPGVGPQGNPADSAVGAPPIRAKYL